MKVEQDNTYIMHDKINIIIEDCLKKISKNYNEEILPEFKKSNFDYTKWNLTLSYGDPGKLILYSILNNYPRALALQKKILHDMTKVPLDLSLFSGLSGIGFSFIFSQQTFQNSMPIINQIDRLLDNNLHLVLDATRKDPFRAQNFDVAQGITGIGNYLLQIKKTGWETNNYIDKDLESILNLLININEHPKSGKLPWWISKENQFLPEEQLIYPEGNYNLGMAHGILGPLTLLLDSKKYGIDGTKIDTCIWRMIQELISFIRKDMQHNKYFWPREASGKSEVHPGDLFIKKNGWCYGNSIISYTLLLAGKVLKAPELTTLGRKLLIEKVLNQANTELTSSILCHGKAGLVMILETIYSKLWKNVQVQRTINLLTSQIIDSFSSKNIFGFSDPEVSVLESSDDKNTTKKTSNQSKSGLLEGTTGILLLLNDQLHLKEKNTQLVNWKNIFLMG